MIMWRELTSRIEKRGWTTYENLPVEIRKDEKSWELSMLYVFPVVWDNDNGFSYMDVAPNRTALDVPGNEFPIEREKGGFIFMTLQALFTCV